MQAVKINNRIPVFGWVVSLLFLGGCIAFSYIVIRDGGGSVQVYPPDIPERYPYWFVYGVLACFWAAGFVALKTFSNFPCTSVEVLPDGSVSMVKRFLFNKEVSVISSRDIRSVEVIETPGGAPYYQVNVYEVSGKFTTISESSDLDGCNKICKQFKDAIGV